MLLTSEAYMPGKVLLHDQPIVDGTDINDDSELPVTAGTSVGTPAIGLAGTFDGGPQSSGAALPNSHFVAHFNLSWTPLIGGDFNGDGNTDVLWQNADGLVAEWFMANGTLQGTKALLNMAGWTAQQSCDLNGDGTADLLWSRGIGGRRRINRAPNG
jgi:hypothetical protein